MNTNAGLYDLIISDSLARALESLPPGLTAKENDLQPLEAAEAFIDAAGRQLTGIMESINAADADSYKERLLASATLINDLLVHARALAGSKRFELDPISQPPRKLLAIASQGIELLRPETGVSAPWLFTAGRGSPSLLQELRREISSADSIDMLVSFITVSGVRKILDLLKDLTSMDAVGASRLKLRILTTTYTGATEAAAIDMLADLPGSKIKISLDGRRTRLHAKAWIFSRQSGFGCAYAGSANLSGAAMLGGLEWTVKFTQRGQESMYERAKAHFETLWEDSEFQSYDHLNEANRTALLAALNREKGHGSTDDQNTEFASAFFNIIPKNYQLEMLDSLTAERARGHCRNLLVAATGTGKTMVAAFDYQRTCAQVGGHPKLLFVAHRKEILQQAIRSFREVLRDHSFGELLADGNVPASYNHLFATIQSLGSQNLVSRFGAEYWHTVIIDECHRLAADSFDALATSIKPHILLGLTATPERSDGRSILGYFDSRADGSPAVELRLWTALDLQLLAPFEYYGCDDETDFSEVPWDRAGAEAAALDKLLTGNHVRARLVINEWQRLSGNAKASKALAFCVNVAHAHFMTECFNKAGIPALCLVGETDKETRRQAPKKLEHGDYAVLVTCDLFNEGIDIPAVDTILLLRPTQSPVLFQQQIGRGLRLSPGKEACLVLDFVGRFRNEYRIDTLFRAITGLSKRELENAVENGFDKLPPGCHIHLEKQPRDRILANLKSIANQTWPRLTAELRQYIVAKGREKISMADFLYSQRLELQDLYRSSGNSGWTALKRSVGLLNDAMGTEDGYFGKRFGALLHIDDYQRTEAICNVAEQCNDYVANNLKDERIVQMLAYQIDGDPNKCGSYTQFAARLAKTPALRSELGELGTMLKETIMLPQVPVPGLGDLPLTLHASYSRREILTAFGIHTAEKRPSYREGVLAIEQRKQEILFVTLDKTTGFHAAIAYHDYAISTELFHWQSQNSAGPDTMAGKRYIESATNGWSFQLFIRSNKESAFKACGPVSLIDWSGSKPLSITWRLKTPLSAKLFSEFSVLNDM